MTVTGCTLSGSAAKGAAGGDGEINFGSGQGGGINDFASLIVCNSTLTDNLAVGTPLAPGKRPDGLERQCGRRRRHLLPHFLRHCPQPRSLPTVRSPAIRLSVAPGAAGSSGGVGEGGGISLIAVPSAAGDRLYACRQRRSRRGRQQRRCGRLRRERWNRPCVRHVRDRQQHHLDCQPGHRRARRLRGTSAVTAWAEASTSAHWRRLRRPDDCSLTLSDSTFAGNRAVGGAGGSLSNGGSGSGSGLSVWRGARRRWIPH